MTLAIGRSFSLFGFLGPRRLKPRSGAGGLDRRAESPAPPKSNCTSSAVGIRGSWLLENNCFPKPLIYFADWEHKVLDFAGDNRVADWPTSRDETPTLKRRIHFPSSGWAAFRGLRLLRNSSFALSGLTDFRAYPGLAPWAAIFRRFAAVAPAFHSTSKSDLRVS